MQVNKAEWDAGAVGLIWFRGGLRVRDNAAVYAALRDNAHVACLFVLDDHYLRGPDIGPARAAFLLASLDELDTTLRAHGGRLIVRRVPGDVAGEVARVAAEVGAGRVYANRDYLPYPMRRDREVAVRLRAEGREFQVCRDVLLADPYSVLTDDGRPYTVFTPFKRRWEGLLRTPARVDLAPLLPHLRPFPDVASAAMPSLEDYGLSLRQTIEQGGEAAGYARLAEFARLGLPSYHSNRDLAADPNSTSRLSMHIKWGTVSIRDCYRAARDAGGPGADKWIDELAWREFYYGVVAHFPHVLEGPLLPEYADFPWSNNQNHLDAWKAGATGYPFVDAGMRQLNATGWMHNRLRQVTASYLVKDLAIHWQEGERYFMQQLVDGDWPANNGGWQWVAGSGTDPRRASRMFNPTLQMERYDPEAEYVRQWIPEYGTRRYPDPIVPHALGRELYLERFHRSAPGRQLLRDARKAEEKGQPKPHVAAREPSLFDAE